MTRPPADTYQAAFRRAAENTQDAHGLAYALAKLVEGLELGPGHVELHGVLLSAATGLERLLAFQAAEHDHLEARLLAGRTRRPGAEAA